MTSTEENPAFAMAEAGTTDLEQALAGLENKTLSPAQVAIMVRAEMQRQIRESREALLADIKTSITGRSGDRATHLLAESGYAAVRSAVARLTETPTNYQ